MKHRLHFNPFFRTFFTVLLLTVAASVYGQNKTLGVGTTTPNVNAALHIESPTNNQGLIIPRLTSAQRLAMTLGAADAGLLVYDTDVNEVISWDGTAWDAGRKYESNDSTATLHVVNNGPFGTDVAGSAAILAETTTAFSAITARIPASASQANALSAITKSSDAGSWAGYFDALTGTAVYGTTKSNVGGSLAPVGVYGESRGTGSVGGAFWIQNASNNYPALYTNTIGVGPSLSVNIDNASNSAPALVINHAGTGLALTTGGKIQAGQFQATSTGSGSVASFAVNNPADTVEAFKVSTNSMGATAIFENTNSSFYGSSIRSTINSNIAGNAFDGISLGTKGHGGSFFVQNGSNPDPAVTIFSQGLGVGLQAGQLANGIAIEVQSGTIRYSTSSTGTPGNITQRAGVYNITATGTYTIAYPTPQDGEATYIFNSSGTSVTVDGTLIADGQLKQYIYIGGSWRSVN